MTGPRVAIVGGGIVGASCAYFLAREGANVTLFEQEEVAYGASGRNPGFVWLHTRTPGFGRNVALAGRSLYDELVEDLPLDFEFRESGGIIFYLTPEQGVVMRDFVNAVTADGFPMELINGADVRRLVPPIRQDVLGATHCPLDSHINTPLLVRSLAEGARQAGAEIREHTPVTGITMDGERAVGVETTEGRFDADAVVLAAGVWSRALAESTGIDLAIGSERLQVVATKPLDIYIEPVVYGPLAAKQYVLFRDLPSWNDEHFTEAYEDEAGIEMLELVAQRKNGEVLLGCPMDYPETIDLTATVEGVARTLEAITRDFPGLRSASVDRVWAGMLPFTTDTVPIIDEARPGLFIAAGHVYGNVAGPISGKLISQLVRGETPSLDLTECRFDRALTIPNSGVATRW